MKELEKAIKATTAAHEQFKNTTASQDVSAALVLLMSLQNRILKSERERKDAGKVLVHAA